MPDPRSDRPTPTRPVPQGSAPRRAEVTPPDPKSPRAAISRANEIVRAIGLRPITGLSGPKIGY